MGENGDNYYNGNDDDDGWYDDDTFEGYIPRTKDPGLFLFLLTTIIVVFFMLMIMPAVVCLKKRRRHRKKKKKKKKALQMQLLNDNNYKPPDEVISPQEDNKNEEQTQDKPMQTEESKTQTQTQTPSQQQQQQQQQQQISPVPPSQDLPLDLLDQPIPPQPTSTKHTDLLSDRYAPINPSESTQQIESPAQQQPQQQQQPDLPINTTDSLNQSHQTQDSNSNSQQDALLTTTTNPLVDSQPKIQSELPADMPDSSSQSVSPPGDPSMNLDETTQTPIINPFDAPPPPPPPTGDYSVVVVDGTHEPVVDLLGVPNNQQAIPQQQLQTKNLTLLAPKDESAEPTTLVSQTNIEQQQHNNTMGVNQQTSDCYVEMGEDDDDDNNDDGEEDKQDNQLDVVPKDMKKVRASLKSIVRYDRESRRILRYTIPFTFYAVANSVLENVCLALVAHFVGTKQVVAYALVGVLVDLSEEFLYGPIYACTTLCSHAIGAGNFFLAGQYVQLAMFFYLMLGIPVVVFWFIYIDNVIMYLEWGDEVVAAYAQDFVNLYIWSTVLDSIGHLIGELLEIQGREIFTTVFAIAKDVANVGALAAAIYFGYEFDLLEVGALYLTTSFISTTLLIIISWARGWLTPFSEGLFGSFSIFNYNAVRPMVLTSIPLAFGSVLSNAEWAILTFFASYLGPAEVAAWAILGSIWDMFEALTHGIGDAAEIRVSYHLGNNHPSLAKLSAYKSLYIGMIGAVIVSGCFFYLMRFIPEWFTPDETLQGMIAVTLPYVAIGNLVLTFGYLCWFMIGAQGRYKLGTWVTFVASWGVTLPLGYVFTHVLTYDLQGLTAAVVLGYVGVSVSLSYLLLTSDWPTRALKIYRRNCEEDDDDDEDEEGEKLVKKSLDDNEEMMDGDCEVYAALASGRSRAAKAQATRNIRLLVVPAGKLGIQIATPSHRPGTVVTDVFSDSPFAGQIFPGDRILAVDGISVANEVASTVYALLLCKDRSERQLTVLSTYNYNDEDTKEIMLNGTVQDIPDFEDDENEQAMLLSGRLV